MSIDCVKIKMDKRCVCLNSGLYALLPAINGEKIRLFPFAAVGNGDYFCFDLVNDMVVLQLHEANRVIPVCRSFSELMGLIDSYR